LMAYSKGLRHGKLLRLRFSTVNSIMEIEDIAADYLNGTLDVTASETSLFTFR